MSAPAAKSAYLGWLAAVIASERGASSSFAAVSDDLILGYATGYDVADVAPFVRSLRAAFEGPAALVVDQNPELLAFLTEHRIEAVQPSPAGEGVWAPHPVVARFAAFDQLIRERPWVRNVLLTDVRDVVFQSAPFEPQPRTLEFFTEYSDGVLGDHAFNMKHLRAVGGDAIARAVADKPCVCVGTVMGPREEMMRFCRTLLMLAAIPRSECGAAFGADQAACNIAVHMGLVAGEIMPNYGRVATVGLADGDRLSVVDGCIINPDAGVSPIVHQHDRHEALAAAMHERWGQGVERRDRCRPKSTAQRGRKLRDSLMRRLPELR
jgi:hypothetical protein